jgi:hypothetical protein
VLGVDSITIQIKKYEIYKINAAGFPSSIFGGGPNIV